MGNEQNSVAELPISKLGLWLFVLGLRFVAALRCICLSKAKDHLAIGIWKSALSSQLRESCEADGSTTEKVVPEPSLDSTVIEPALASITSRQV